MALANTGFFSSSFSLRRSGVSGLDFASQLSPHESLNVFPVLYKCTGPGLALSRKNHMVFASDPDPVLDFCIATTKESTSSKPSCKNSSTVTVEDFTFSGIKFPGNYSQTGFSAMSVNSNVFPGLNSLGMSFVRADFDVGGINVPHFHPRATETAFVMEGRIYSGFVDTSNRVFAKVVEKGEVMVFPRGLVHFQMNVGHTPATILGSFNSQNPGLQKIPAAIFGSGIREDLLEKAFGLSANEIAKLRRRFVPH